MARVVEDATHLLDLVLDSHSRHAMGAHAASEEQLMCPGRD